MSTWVHVTRVARQNLMMQNSDFLADYFTDRLIEEFIYSLPIGFHVTTDSDWQIDVDEDTAFQMDAVDFRLYREVERRT